MYGQGMMPHAESNKGWLGCVVTQVRPLDITKRQNLLCIGTFCSETMKF